MVSVDTAQPIVVLVADEVVLLANTLVAADAGDLLALFVQIIGHVGVQEGLRAHLKKHVFRVLLHVECMVTQIRIAPNFTLKVGCGFGG